MHTQFPNLVLLIQTIGQCTGFLEEHDTTGTVLLHKDYTWTTDSAGNP